MTKDNVAMDNSTEPFNALAVTMNGTKRPEDEMPAPHYTMSGILHFLQTEWARFEMDRAQWEVDRAELQAKIAFLQGERKGQENLKSDLVRRIKMLEFALRQERCKYHRLKYGTELEQVDMIPPKFEKELRDDHVNGDFVSHTNDNNSWKNGRQLLRQYLQEIGYTDTIIDVRSARIRHLLGLPSRDAAAAESKTSLSSDQTTGKRMIEAQGNGSYAKKLQSSLPGSDIVNTEQSIMATFDFLASQNVDDDDEDDDDDGMANGDSHNGHDMRSAEQLLANRFKPTKSDVMADEADTEEALAEFDFLMQDGKTQSPGSTGSQAVKDNSEGDEWSVDEQMLQEMKDSYLQVRRKDRKSAGGHVTISDRPSKSALKAMLINLDSDEAMPPLQSGSISPPAHGATSGMIDIHVPDDHVDNEEEDENVAALGLGELADLTVFNEADTSSYDLQNVLVTEGHRKLWTARYSLRSHFDGIRSVVFHPVEAALITAGEDHVIKLWSLQKSPVKKVDAMDLEPVYTMRGHCGAVLSLAVSPTGEFCYSGGIDGTLCCWKLPNICVDQYDAYDASVLQARLESHADAVWDLSAHSTLPHILSCSADGSVKLWAPHSSKALLSDFVLDANTGIPTSVDFIRSEPNHMVAAYNNKTACIFDMESAKPILKFEYEPNDEFNGREQINCVVSHPTLPLTITAHEDHHLRFFDNNTGQLVHAMVAHLDAVTSLAVDRSGLYVLSGSHDSSIRLWNIETKTCMQELTVHRKKFDESVNDVAFHPSKPYIASAGADAVAKVYV